MFTFLKYLSKLVQPDAVNNLFISIPKRLLYHLYQIFFVRSIYNLLNGMANLEQFPRILQQYRPQKNLYIS